jgi:hypothetical protein
LQSWLIKAHGGIACAWTLGSPKKNYASV